MPSGFQSTKKILLPLAIFLITVLARTIPGPRTIDDSYITYRYVRNILAGNGFVYNPGEHVLGTTTPLYTILLTGLGIVSGGVDAPFPTIALTINALLDGLMSLLLISLGNKLSYRWAGTSAALVWAIAPFSVTFSIGGLETSLFVLLITGVIWAHISKLHTLTSLLSALSILTRPDALIMVIPVILDRMIQVLKTFSPKNHSQVPNPYRKLSSNRLAYTKEILIFLVPITIWIIFATIYFGNPLPHSIAAKSLAYRLPAEAAFVRLLQHYATPFLGHLTLGINWIKVGLFLYPFLFLVGFRNLLKNEIQIWPFLVYPWLYFGIFSIANPLIFRWYLTPPLPAYIFGILAGLEVIAGSVFSKHKTHDNSDRVTFTQNPIGKFIITFVFAIPIALSLRGWQLKPDHGLQRPAPEMAWYKLELIYKAAAEIIQSDLQNINPKPLLAAGDVGVLGYITDARILDTVGLNSPITTQYYPLDQKYYVTNYAIPPGLIVDQQPDYLVMLEVYGRFGLLTDSRFHSQYRLLEVLPTDIYGSNGMLIYRKANY